MTKAAKKAFVARMKAARKKSHNPESNKTKSSARKKNHMHSSRRKSSRNPQVLGRTPGKLLKEILTALASAVATKQIPQEVLQANNAGWQGYLANLVTASLATFGAHALMGPDEALAAALGGGIIIVDRILTETISPIGSYLALTGLGDATAARQLGGTPDGTYFIQPTIYDANGNPIIPHQITDAAVQKFLSMAPAPAAATPATAAAQLMAGPGNKQMGTPSRYKRGPGN